MPVRSAEEFEPTDPISTMTASDRRNKPQLSRATNWKRVSANAARPMQGSPEKDQCAQGSQDRLLAESPTSLSQWGSDRGTRRRSLALSSPERRPSQNDRQFGKAVRTAIGASSRKEASIRSRLRSSFGPHRARPRNPSFILVTRKRALEEAAASRKRHREGRAVGPLDGVPIAWKDLVDMADERTTAGSALYAASPPKEKDATIVTNLSAAAWWRWARPIFRNSPSRRSGSIRISGRRGIPLIRRRLASLEGRRQARRSRSPAVLRLARSAATPSGSIRAPASFCGIVGFKTSEGRVDKQGVFPLSRTLDTIGPLAHTVEDCVLIDMALRGQPTTPVRPLDLKGIEFVVPDKTGIDDARPRSRPTSKLR